MLFSDLPPPPSKPSAEIVVTASLAPAPASATPATVTVLDPERIARLGEPLAASLLRQIPSVAVASSGPAGSVAEVRIRGAESNHTLLFIDGIRANDPAAGNIPRFELLSADLASRIEAVRGPQSALWGSEAIGGVVAVEGVSSGRTTSATAEAGSFGYRRVAAGIGRTLGPLRIDLGGGDQRSGGIDAFAAAPKGGERDGYHNRTVRGRVALTAAPGVEIGASGFAIAARSDFDGYDPLTFDRTETLDNTHNRLRAGRVWVRLDRAGWVATIAASALGSVNRNQLDEALVNRTAATRDTLSATLERGFTTGSIDHRLIVAGEAQHEHFRSDNPTDPFADQVRRRHQSAVTGEYRLTLPDRLTADIAIRHDAFGSFADATTVRAAALLTAAPGVQIGLSYGEGIAQPTFYDLYGYYPGSFIGNPRLTPERSRGVEASLRLSHGAWRASAAVYRQRLHDEIVDRFDFATFQSSSVNAKGVSKRQGAEIELAWAPSLALRLSANAAWLDATQRPDPTVPAQRELRRPRHSGALLADGAAGRFTYAAALTYTGAHDDRRDSFPYNVVSLDGYVLASARIAYRVANGFELFGRVANGFGAHYQDVSGYRTEGRSVNAGLRLALGG